MRSYDKNQIWADILAEPTVKNVCRLVRADIDERIGAYGHVDSGSGSSPKLERALTLAKLVQTEGDAPVRLPDWYVLSTVRNGTGVELCHVVRCATLADARHQHALYSNLRGFSSHEPVQLEPEAARLLEDIMTKGGEGHCL